MTPISKTLGAFATAGIALAATAGAAADMPKIASKDAGMKRFKMTKQYIKDNGVQAAIKKIRNDAEPFSEKYPAVYIMKTQNGQHFVVAHTTYASLKGVNFTNQTDLEGRKFIQNFFAKVKQGGGFAKTTNAVPPEGKRHLSQCYNEWVPGHKGKYWMGVCYDHPSIR